MRPQRKPPSNNSNSAANSAADIESWLKELDPHLPQLVRQVLGKRGWSMQPADIDDVVQSIRIELWSTDLKHYDASRGRLVPYVVNRVFWETASFFRRQKRQQDRLDEYIADLDDDEPALTPEDNVHEAEHAQLLEELVTWAREKLPTPLERAAVLASVEKCTLNDVAVRLAVHPSRVKRARQRGLSRLQQIAPSSLDALRKRGRQ